MRRLAVVLLGAFLGTVLPLSAAEAAPKRANPAWVQTCTSAPVLSGPWKRFVGQQPTCRLTKRVR